MRKMISAIMLVMLSINLFGITVSASSNEIPIEIRPLLTDNQNKDISSYFSIKNDKKSINQNFDLLVTNKSNENQKVEIKVVDAYTSPNGIVEYTDIETDNNEITDEAYKISEYLKMDEGDDSITLKPNEERVISSNMKAEDIKGTLLGGISFQVVTEGDEIREEDNSFKINNEINMVVGVKIDFDINGKVDLSLGEPTVDPMPAYYVVRLPINLESPLLKKMDIDYQVLYNNEKLFENEKNVTFAPMTSSDIALPWDYDKIEKDKEYTLKGKIKYTDIDGSSEEVAFEKAFEYKDVKNDGGVKSFLQAPFEKQNNGYWFIITLVAVGAVVYLLTRKRVYVLYSDVEAIPIIGKGEDQYNNLLPKKGSVNTNDAKFSHQYVKKKDTDTEKVNYVFLKTTKNT